MGGHYQTSHQRGNRVITAFNMHPGGERATNAPTSISSRPTTWARPGATSQASRCTVPLTEPQNPALVRDYQAEKRLVYIHDLDLDGTGRPVILYITSADYRPGPQGDPRWWTVAHWTGQRGSTPK